MPVAPEVIADVKGRHDLVEVVQSHGVALKQRGKDWVGLCPFHDETSPSFTVNARDQLYHCFGCPPDGKTGGDVITFVSRARGIPFPAAVAYLGGGASAPPMNGNGSTDPGVNGAAIKGRARRPSAPRSSDSASPKGPSSLTAEQQKLLARVVRFYRAGFESDPRGRAYLAERGIRDGDSLEAFGVGFVAGNLVEALPQDADLEEALRALGILNKRGREVFFGCVVFPLLDPGTSAPVGLYGRRTEDGEVSHLYLAGPRRGVVNAGAAKRTNRILLAESVIDALSLYANGFRNVIPCYGTQGFLAVHEEHLVRYGVEEVYVVFDADAPGREAAGLVAERISSKGMRSYVVNLPEKDASDFFLRHTPEEMEALLKRANPRTLERSEQVQKRGETSFETTEHGFNVVFGARRYEVKGIARRGTQLKIVLRAEPDHPGTDPGMGARKGFEVTSVDLYSSRHRERTAKVLSRIFGEAEPLVREDLMRLIEKVEEHQATAAAAETTEAQPVKLSDRERAEALSLLTAPDLDRRIVDDLTTMGLTGEETNKLLGYLVATSRKLREPLSMVIQSRSGAGKSALQDAVLSLMPPEDLCKYTRITDQALFYREGSSLEHKILALEEAEGMGGAVYSLRALQSAGEVRILSTGKNPQMANWKAAKRW